MCSSTPSSWQKFAEFKRNLRKRERKKIHTEQPWQILRFIADFPVLQSCQTTAVPEGDYLQTPHGLGHHVSSDDVTRDLCAAACCLRNSWRQKSSWSRIHGRIWALTLFGTTCWQLPNKERGVSSGECCFSWVPFPVQEAAPERFSHRVTSMRQNSFSFTTSIRNSLSSALRQRLLTILPTMLLSYQHY